MLIQPSIVELTKDKYNAYTVVIAAAKGARMVTDEYVAQRERADRMVANKETDKPINTMIDRELRDEKAVKVAINRMYRGEYSIDTDAAEATAVAAEESEEASVEEAETDDTAEQ